VKRIRHHQDHSTALSRLEELMVSDPAIGSVEEQELVELAERIDRYERENIDIPKPTDEEMNLFRMEQSQ
jgi:antitoxin component HigA of HigAB toxin-antitoxin module